MREVVLYTLMSLDGAVDNPAAYFLPREKFSQEPGFDSVMEGNEASITSAQDAVLLGRGMYDEWSRYWPRIEQHPFADFINTVKKYVMTSTPLSNDWHNSEAVARPVGDLLSDLKAQPGGDIGVHGSIQLAQSLLAAGLVDKLHLVIGAAFGFPGRRLFSSAEDVRQLELLSALATPSGGLILAYRPI